MKIRCHVRHEDTHSVYYCNLAVGHEGSHMHRSISGEVYATWGDPCPERQAGYLCALDKGHPGDHQIRGANGTIWHTWPQESPKPKPKPKPEEHSVLLTLEELKSLVYALSGSEWLEDEPELVAKIENVLKEAL